MAAALKEEHGAFSEGTRRRIQSRHTFINVATCEMPRIVPKFISAPELERGEGLIQVLHLQGWALKQDVFFRFIFCC